MRVPFTRRAAIAASIVAIAVAPLAACSDDEDSSSETTTSAAATSSAAETSAAAAGAAADAATTEAVTTAYVTFFNGTGDPAARTAYVEDPEVLATALQGMTQNPAAAGTSATVTAVTTGADATHANVTWTLNINGAPVIPDASGEAVNEDGTWKVANATVCNVMALQSQGTPIPGC